MGALALARIKWIYNQHDVGEGCKHTIVKRCDTVTKEMAARVVPNYEELSTERHDPRDTYPTPESMLATEDDYLGMWDTFFRRCDLVAAAERANDHKQLPHHAPPPTVRTPNFDPSQHSSGPSVQVQVQA